MAHPFSRQLVSQLQAQGAGTAATADDFPAYGEAEMADLAGQSRLESFRLGTGASVFASSLLPAMLAARHEIVFVTCFWAPSTSLSDLASTLARLAARRSQPADPAAVRVRAPLRIRIGLSSRSFLQKLLHTGSRDGYVYPPDTWASQLGLPPADVLQAAGIDLVVKSLFFLPFSVMHPKFVVIDRKRALLPSCNLSWESWLECCVEFTGDAVRPLLSFYGRTWGDDLPALPTVSGGEDGEDGDQAHAPAEISSPAGFAVRFPPEAPPLPTVLLPSSHHRNPHFRPFPWQTTAPPPPTPLNTALLQLFAAAERHIYVQTPNVTSEPAVAALLAALGRGVDVSIVTGRRMMVLEQLLTAGTTTARCLAAFVSRYEEVRRQAAGPCGKLCIAYFAPLLPADPQGRRPLPDEEQALTAPASLRTNASGFVVDDAEPVHSHAKLTIVDGQHTVLGSGNMDRASWYTSQELGILFHDAAFAALVQAAVKRVLDGRLQPFYST